jgi:hypothetical protein
LPRQNWGVFGKTGYVWGGWRWVNQYFQLRISPGIFFLIVINNHQIAENQYFE